MMLLDVDSAEAVRTAYEDVMDAALTAAAGDDIKGGLVQPMVDDGVEVITGIAPDKVFGSLISVGPGGVLVEALDESSTLVPPFSQADARAAVEDTALTSFLRNRRQGDALSVDAVADFLTRVGDLATGVDSVAELDPNPVVVTEDGPVAVDRLV